MVFGKKNYPSYQRRRRRSLGLGTLVVVLLLTGGVWFGWGKYVDMNRAKGDQFLQEGDLVSAEKAYSKTVGLPLSSGRGRAGLAALALLNEDKGLFEEHSQVVLDKGRAPSQDHITAVLDTFVAQGRYEAGNTYISFLERLLPERDRRPFALKFTALAMGGRDLDAAAAFLEGAGADLKRTARYGKLQEQVNAWRKEGAVPVMLDRRGRPLLSYNVKTKEYEFASPRIFAGWRGKDGLESEMAALDSVERQNKLQTTIDMDLQKAAANAMAGYNGTMMLVEPKSGDILAAFGTEGYNPFSTTFEPGSVMKVLTYAFFLEDDGNTSNYAPKKYPSGIRIDDKIFYDWTEQGQLDTVEEGMAVSCNLMFAQMGLEMTWPGLSKGLTRIFNGEQMGGYWGQGTFGGVLRDPENDWDLANISIGLDLIETSVLGLSLIPSGIANGGTMIKPRLISGVLNVEDQPIAAREAESMGRLYADWVAEKLDKSMRVSVTDKRGTARRAEVEFVESAMKTGTSGSRPFNSVMVGMFPADNPTIAFALFLHNGGKCEYHGAKVAKLLMEGVRENAPEYLDP